MCLRITYTAQNATRAELWKQMSVLRLQFGSYAESFEVTAFLASSSCVFQENCTKLTWPCVSNAFDNKLLVSRDASHQQISPPLPSYYCNLLAAKIVAVASNRLSQTEAATSLNSSGSEDIETLAP